jgi:hypothetical protein
MSNVPTKDNEHIFSETKIRPMVLTWKRLLEEDKKDEAMDLLNLIIIDCTEMFKRLAQYEKFHHTVSLDHLVTSAQIKVPVWLIKWDPAKGSLFSWLSKCAKNVFRSELVKVNSFTKRVHCTDDSEALERLSGHTESGHDFHDKTHQLSQKIRSMVCPWAHTEIRAAIQYIVECIRSDNHNKQACIRGASFAWGLSFDVTKFLYSWTNVQLRDLLYDEGHIRLTEQDIFRAANTWTHLPQLLDVVGWKTTKKIIALFGGQRFRIPSVAECARVCQNERLHREIRNSDMDPDSIVAIASRYNKTEKTATDIFVEMTGVLDPAFSGEYPVYQYDSHTRESND